MTIKRQLVDLRLELETELEREPSFIERLTSDTDQNKREKEILKDHILTVLELMNSKIPYTQIEAKIKALAAFARNANPVLTGEYYNKTKTIFYSAPLDDILDEFTTLDRFLIETQITDEKRAEFEQKRAEFNEGLASRNNHAAPPFAENDPQRTLAHRNLLQQIAVMKEFGINLLTNSDETGMIAIKLASKLTDKTNNFFKLSEQNQSMGLAVFKKEFNTLLNSENDKIAPTYPLWLRIVANILAALVFPVLALKLCHSLATTNKCSFFLDRTEYGTRLDAIEENVSTLSLNS